MAEGKPLIIAHRGASEVAPENTLAAFRLAWQQGADGIEGDFRLSSDGVIVCMHDATTKRVSAERLNVARSTFEALRKVDVGSKKGAKWADERIPSLKEVLSTVPEGKKIFIEVKCGVEIVLPLKEVIEQSALKPEQIAIISFDKDVIARAKTLLPAVDAFWITVFRRASSAERILATLKTIRADGLSCKASRHIDADFVKQLRHAKMAFHVWTVDTRERAQYFHALGADSMTSNRPQWLKTLLYGGIGK